MTDTDALVPALILYVCCALFARSAAAVPVSLEGAFHRARAGKRIAFSLIYATAKQRGLPSMIEGNRFKVSLDEEKQGDLRTANASASTIMTMLHA
jgi:hypothetical protein